MSSSTTALDQPNPHVKAQSRELPSRIESLPRPELKRPVRKVRFRSLVDVFGYSEMEPAESPQRLLTMDTQAIQRPLPKYKASSLRLFLTTLLIAIGLWILRWSPLISTDFFRLGVRAASMDPSRTAPSLHDSVIETRQSDDPTNYCKRWSHQSALVNGTIYIYGGRKTSSSTQTAGTWNNQFLSLDVSKSWQISSPIFNALDTPLGPPAVANGYLWHSYDQLFLYGGEYSDNPITIPSAFALWSYDIGSKEWSEMSVPSTSPGNNSDGGNKPVLNVAEGAGLSIPSLGRGYYFGGHQDQYTTPGWSNQIFRGYLKSLVEYTFPGYKNDGVANYATTPAPSMGAWRNITTGGIQAKDGFAERADGVLTYVPGFGASGIILSIGGGNNVSFPEMNIIDVYDIATSTWYQQATSGAYPKIRVNPCAVAASAPDGSSTNVYLFGGQALQPYGAQEQYSDMWILSIPSFTWISVDASSQSVPPGRSGHTCEVWNGQMIVLGGYVGAQIACESPGVFVFDMSSLKWVNTFTALSGANVEDQQPGQSDDPNALEGSYGYKVPPAVQAIVGGSDLGGAIATSPQATALAGPLATGSAIIYTVTNSAGVPISTSDTTSSTSGTNNSGDSNSTTAGPNIAAIVAGTIAGLLFLLVCYLGFCTYIYRRQLQIYKKHVAAAQRAAAAAPHEKHGLLPALAAATDRRDTNRHDASLQVTNSNSNSNTRSSEGRSRSSYAASRFSRRGGAGGAGIEGGENIPPVPSLGGYSNRANATNGISGSGGGLLPRERRGSAAAAGSESDEEDLLLSYEPTFAGVLLNPRRSLRVINRD